MLRGTNDKGANELLAEGVRGAEKSIGEHLQRAFETTRGQLQTLVARKAESGPPRGRGGKTPSR